MILTPGDALYITNVIRTKIIIAIKKGCTESTYCTTTLNINFKKDGTKPFYIKAVRGEKVKFERVPVTQEA